MGEVRGSLAGDRYLPFSHEFEHGRLHLCGSSVNFIGQHEVHEDWTELDIEGFLRCRVDAGADDVGRNEVRSELDACETAAQNGRKGAYGKGLSDAWNTLKKDVALGKHPDHELLDHALLANDDPLYLPDGLTDETSCLVVRHRGILVPLTDVLTIRVVLGAH